jgi:hypothetical protein
MKLQVWLGAILFVVIAGARGSGGEPACCPPPEPNFLKRFHPVGGWHPDSGGLLRWWPKHCFPCCGGPDDYCRKPLPCVCWPPYPPYYKWVSPEICPPRDCCRPH